MFAKEQPDLNWENPKVKKELFDMINWWLDKGIAGFRIDAIINIKKTSISQATSRTDRTACAPARLWWNG